ISDAEYDELLRRLQAIENAHPELITADSPTQRVGATPQSGFETVRHGQQMLSLANVTTREEMAEFDTRVRKLLGRERVEYVVEQSCDGVAAAVVSGGGLLAVGSPRGDGPVGETVPATRRPIRGVPLRLGDGERAPPPRLEVRGEVYLPVRAFRALNRERE